MARLYISGPVTGIELRNYPAFRDAQLLLADSGYYADLPHDLVCPGDAHETAMLLCVHEVTRRDQKFGAKGLVPYYDGVALLPGWEASDGAKLEKAVAEACGIPAKTVDEWIEEAS